MAAPRPKSRDLGAALAGLVLGGSVMFLIILTIVWLTNRHFDSKRESEKATHGPAAAVAVPGPIPTTTGSGSQAPVAPPAHTPGGSPTGATTRTETVPSSAAPSSRAPATSQPPPPPLKR